MKRIEIRDEIIEELRELSRSVKIPKGDNPEEFRSIDWLTNQVEMLEENIKILREAASNEDVLTSVMESGDNYVKYNVNKEYGTLSILAPAHIERNGIYEVIQSLQDALIRVEKARDYWLEDVGERYLQVHLRVGDIVVCEVKDRYPYEKEDWIMKDGIKFTERYVVTSTETNLYGQVITLRGKTFAHPASKFRKIGREGDVK